MADNVFSKDPVEALVQGVSKRPGANSRAAIEGIATKSQVPANFLMAFTELSPAKSDDDTARVAQAIADKIAPRLTAGEKIEDVVRSLAGDDKTSADQFIERAYQIADDLYPDRKAPVKEEPGLVEDIGRALGGSLVRGAGGMVEAAGLAAEEASRFVFSGEEDVTGVREAAREAGDFVRQYGEGIQAGMSEEAKRAIAESTPEGNIFDPSTWSAGKNPSLKGYALLGADVLGSFLPVVATAVITKSPTATAAVGGLQGGGAGAETARDILTRAAETIGPDGRSLLEHNSAYYRDLLAAGISREDAVARTIDAGVRMAFLMTAPVSAFGGAATSKILLPGERALIGSGPLTRALGTAALSSLEEGTQEVAETLATRYGAQRATGMELDLAQGTFGDFILGALGGGIPGAAAGAFQGAGRDDEEAPPEAPDGSEPAGPLLALPAPSGPEAPQAAPKRTAPIKNVLKSAPPQIVPDVPAGGTVTVRAGDLPPVVGKIVRDDGVMVTIQDENGETIDVAMSQIESGEATIEVANAPAAPDAPLSQQALSKVAPPSPKVKTKPTPDEARTLLEKLERQAEMTGWTKRATARKQELEDIIASASPFDAAASALEEQGFYDGPWNEPTPETPAAEVAAKTAGEAPLGGERTTPTTGAPSGADIARFIGSFDQVAEDSGEIATVQVTDKGPWDFNDTWPAPDAEKVAARESEGRVEFGLDDGPEAVVGILTETLNEMTAETGFARQWEGELARIEAGEKPRFKVGKGEDPATVARRNAEEARRNAFGVEGALRDVWSDEAVDAMVAQANAVIDREKRAPEAAPRDREGAAQTDAAASPKPEIKPAAKEAVQPDLLGRREKTETEIAAQERRRREWGQYLAIAEGGTSVWEGDLEAATVKINRRTVTIKGPNGSRVTDTDGISRSDLVGWSRWAMGQVGGFAQAAQRPEPERPKSFEGNLSDAQKANGAPTSAEVKAAAREADRNPSEAQKDAGNYKMGHITWNGLDITIETAKGAMRRGKDGDGEEWSVKMPAHYGYIKRTTGADGDHLDVYMGDHPESDLVVVIDQIDAKTGDFDEHKIILGTRSRKEAMDLYTAGFSDGKGGDRIGGVLVMNVPSFQMALKDGSLWNGPMANAEGVGRPKPAPMAHMPKRVSHGVEARKHAEEKAAAPAEPKKSALSSLTQAEQDRAALLRARIADRMRNQLNTGLDPELLKDAVDLVGIYVKAGLRRFRAMLDQVAQDMGLTAREIEPWARAAYNQARDDMELDGQDVGDMDDSKAVLAAVKALRAAPSQIPAESTMLDAEGRTEAANGDRVDAGSDRKSTEGGTGLAAQGPEGSRDRGEGKPEAGARDDGAERSAGRAQRRKVDAGDDLFGGTLRDDGGRARNFVIEPGGLNPKAGEKTRARESVAAIRTLREMGSRILPTQEEQKVLSRYGGAGTLAGALPRSDGSIKFPDIAADLDALLTEDEKRTLSRTSQYAFYTAEPALRAMWSLAQRLGFKGGRVFEPGMGVGGFIGTVPAQIRHATDYRGIELDHVTAAIAKRLYPESQIDSGDFIKTPLPSSYYDLAIGNPPFAGIKVQADPDYPQGFFLHDYFFAKTLDAVRPGGILMFVTSAGTMNKQDTAARDYLADRADLLGAIRLPNTAFKENGTEVTTDIIVLRKRLDSEKEANPSWRRSEVIDVPDPDGGTGKAAVNRYFIDHPEMILGEQGLYDTLTAANRIGVRPKPGSDLAADLAEALARFTPGVMSEAPASIRMDARDTATTERKAGSYYMKDGDLYQFDGAAGVKVERRTRAAPSGVSRGDYETIADLLPIRDALRDVYAADVDGKDATEARARMNATYDAFVKKRGPINLQVRDERRPSIVEQESARQRAREDARAAGLDFDEGSFDPSALFEAGAKLSDIARARNEARKEPGYREGDFNPEDMTDKVLVSYPNIDPFADDPESFRLRAIEEYDPETDTAQKSRVFTENAVTISVKPTISSPEDALLYVLSEDGRVDLNKIADLSGSTPGVVRQELGEKIFEDPASGEWQTAAKYLSGNVRKKLDEARASARTKPELQINVQALEAVQPSPIPAADIRVPIGAHWFPSEIYSQFARSLGLRLEATFRPSLGIWTVDGSKTEQAARNDWGTEDIPFADLMQRVMNNKPLKVTRTTKDADGSTHTFTDEAATQAANDKANELRNRFSQWFWEDRDRAEEMEVLYNSVFNAEVAPKYDGGYLTTPGIHADWSWHPHQTSAIARFLQSGNTYLAHTVGAGKTSEMIGIAMEGRRLGIVRKPMIVVPNHMLVQFATEFYQQYPLANILVADDRRFHTSRRKQFIADVALGNWDAIVITHSAFGLIPVSDAAKGAAVSDMLRDIRDVLGDATASGDRGSDMATDRAILGALESVAATLGVDTSNLKEKGVSTRKKIERLLEAAEQRIARQTSNRGKDQVFDFDELGVDTLMIDEAHLFRKLSFATTNGAIKGIDPAGSQASMDLYVKTRALDAVNPGRSLIFASGTPITNTMAELYTLSRYLQPLALAERGMTAFDAWAGSFGQVDTALEQTPDGGYKEVSRFAKFVNTPELSLMVRQIMDVVSGQDLEKYVTRPKLKGGKRTHVVVEPSPEVLAYRDSLSARMKAIENRKGPVQKGDDILLSVINDGRLSAIDMRLVDPAATGHGSKLERMIQNVYRTWKDGANAPLHGVKKEGGYTDEPIMRGPSTQIVFATLGINPSKHNPDFSVHRFIKAELVRMGIPASDIILQEDLKTQALKQRAFGDMNEGRRRILVGSKTLFTGVNAQRRIAAIHNLDPLWFPADDEQRNGRGIRQGNMNPEIEIFDYSTKGTYDATMWQMMARKASFIEAFFRGDPNMREMEDLGEASAYEQAKALSTKDPRVLVLTELKAESDKLQRRSEAVRRQKSKLTNEIRYQASRIKSLSEDREAWAKVAPKVVDLSGDKFVITIDGQDHAKRTEAGNALFSIAEAAVAEEKRVENRKVGTISGFPIFLSTFKADNSASFHIEAFTDARVDAGWSADPVGLMRRLEGTVASIAENVPMIDNAIRRAEKLKSDAEAALSRVKPFSEHAEIESLRKKIADLELEMLAETKAGTAKEDDEAESRFIGSEPVATLTGEELGEWSDMIDLQRRAQAWYRDNLQGKTIVNSETGWEIRFTRAGAGKMRGKPLDYLLRAVPGLPEIVANATFIGSDTDRRHRPHIKAVHYFRANVSIAARVEPIHIVIREMDDGRKFYDINLGRIVGARTEGPKDAREDRVEPDAKVSADTLNIAISDEAFNEGRVVRDEAALTATISRVMRRHGLAGKVPAGLVRGLIGAQGRRIAGRYKNGEIALDPDSGDVVGTLLHEIIHALRQAFTAAEWDGLVRAAKARPGIKERVNEHYSERSLAHREEEMVAELYREAAAEADANGAIGRLLRRIRTFIEALGSALRGDGFTTVAITLERIASGKIGNRLPARSADGRFISEAEHFMASLPDFGFSRTGGDPEANERGIVGHLLTNAMSGKNGVNLLALVPGRALFNELGRHIPSAQAYLRSKDAMDALRNKWQEKTDVVAQAWRKLIAQHSKANAVLMDLMHDATIAGVDPSRPFIPRADNLMKRAREEYSRFGEDAEAWALGMVRAEERKKAIHAELRQRYNGLPEAFRAMFVRVRNAYGELGDAFEQAVLDNARKAMNLGLKRAEQRYQDDLRAIDDDGLEGAEREEAEERALERLENAKKRAGWNSQARLAALRAKFESNRLDGPYFPLARFGNFFVTLRDSDGKVISFSRFETEGDQAREAKRLAAEHPDGTVQTGVLSDVNSLRNQVDPNFVADVEDLIAEEVGDPKIMDMIWQRWLETLPDLSVRRSRLHRKGTPGYSGDAFRAFGRQMFHGSHQLARLKYAMDMQQNLMDARREAANAADPNRAGLVVTEMERRHAFTMNPVGSSWAQYAGTAAFIYYLAVTPAAAMVNLTQTTIIGVPVLAAAFKDGGISKAATEITKASRDFIGGRGHAQASANLNDDEKAAMREAYDRGVVDKTQAHDLAGVAETGVEYNAAWQKWMAKIAWLFHHAERMNREVTFLAGYRMGRAAGMDHEAAISKAADVTWKSHFDYQNTSRPRLMQNDYMKVLLTYRNYVINMNYRLFRDLHQMLKGETAEDRREARAQLGGITLSMMLHAGIKGTWGYALITSLLGMFADDGEDDVEEALQSALVRLFGTQVAGMMLKGVPGHLTGVDLTRRIGMPELWFRSSDRALEGEDAYVYWLSEMVGPVPGIAENAFRGAAKIGDGDFFKGVEAMMPKAIRDLMKAYRYATEGATTASGLPLVDNVGVVDAMKQALGFTPARIAEAYEVNSRLKNRENRIETERSRIVNAAMREVMAGNLSDATLAKVQSFNEENPDYPITGDTIRQAASGRARAERDTVGGTRLNRRLDARLRGEAAPLLYN